MHKPITGVITIRMTVSRLKLVINQFSHICNVLSFYQMHVFIYYICILKIFERMIAKLLLH